MDVIAGEDGVLTVCGHTFCLSDYSSWTDTNAQCPSCRHPIENTQNYLSLTQIRLEVHALLRKQGRKEARVGAFSKSDVPKKNSLDFSGLSFRKRVFEDECLPKPKREKGNGPGSTENVELALYPTDSVDLKQTIAVHRPAADGKARKFVQSAKIKTLIAAIEEMIAAGNDKALVFSQWTRMLDLIEVPLRELGIKSVRLDGTMSAAERASTVNSFKQRSDVRLFLISLKAGGCGLVSFFPLLLSKNIMLSIFSTQRLISQVFLFILSTMPCSA